MIDLKGKNKWVVPVIEEAGHNVWTHDGVVLSTNDAAVQLIIDGYDAVPSAKKDKRIELRGEQRNRMIIVYPDAEDMPETHFDVVIDMCFDVFRSVINASRNPNADWQNVLDVRTAKRNARTEINALTTLAEVLAYDVVTQPAWPV